MNRNTTLSWLTVTPVCLLMIATVYPVNAATTLTDAVINEGDVYANFRYRYEHVDDDLAPKNANASTLRSAIGYQSGELYGLSALLEAELVNRIFSGDYREYPGQIGSTAAVVADPDSTELNQGYLQYTRENSRVRVGRQIITYRDAPFHRFMGTVLWRQNWQTHDAISLQNTSLPDTTLSYAYIWNVNRIFGDDAPPVLSDFDSDSHVVNIQYERFSTIQLEGYGYFLDFDNAPAASSATVGVRVHGSYPWRDSLKPIYALEFAHQTDHGANRGNYDVSYQLIEGGLKMSPDGPVTSVVLKASFERLEGTGNTAFQTPLGTNHAFQGTADRFLTTLGDGIHDTYGTLVATLHKYKLIAGYHMLSSDKFDYDYGEELDLQLTRSIGQRFTIGAKYAHYDADTNVTNLARNGITTVSADAEKFWLFMTASF